MKTRRKAGGKPETLKKGSFTASLYRARKTVSGRDYEIHRLVYVEPGGGRKVRDFGSKEKARTVFEEVAKAAALGRPDALSWSPKERAEFDAALRALDGTGFGLMQAADLFATAVRRLPAGSNLLEAVDEFARRHPANAERRTVAEVVAELIEDAGRRNLSPGHLRDMPQRLNPFAEAFQCQIASVEAPAVKRYLDNLRGVNGQALSARSRKNSHRLICNLFNFGRRQRYVPRELAEEISEIEIEKPRTGKVEIFEPWEIKAVLDAADDADRSLLAIGAFAGLRTSELQRLTSEAVRLNQRSIILEASDTKTGARRVVPILDNLAEWLAPYASHEGRFSRHTCDSALAWSFGKAAQRAGVEWKRNALRHSFISYRLAVINDVPKVAYEAGNSPRIISTNYLQAVTEPEARAWFAVRPAQASNVIPMIATA